VLQEQIKLSMDEEATEQQRGETVPAASPQLVNVDEQNIGRSRQESNAETWHRQRASFTAHQHNEVPRSTGKVALVVVIIRPQVANAALHNSHKQRDEEFRLELSWKSKHRR
jgi:hypothetical protein